MRKLELLSPARNKEVAIAAINNGADAVYIGATAFGARQAASNSILDISEVVEYAHLFNCKVFVTLNTILYDNELEEVQGLIEDLNSIKIDALIIQDPAIFKLNTYGIPLHASTQMHNYDIERIKWIESMGVERIVLARELSLEQIKFIRQNTTVELEYFVHGALCVSLSGQCYVSQYMYKRSANRGECAQICRMKWDVVDSVGNKLVDDKYILSLKDLNLSNHLEELAEAGIDSFKIEGRLKDIDYVSNITQYYSNKLNSLIDKGNKYRRASQGNSVAGFKPDPFKSFNRGFSTYFFSERKKD